MYKTKTYVFSDMFIPQRRQDGNSSRNPSKNNFKFEWNLIFHKSLNHVRLQK